MAAVLFSLKCPIPEIGNVVIWGILFLVVFSIIVWFSINCGYIRARDNSFKNAPLLPICSRVPSWCSWCYLPVNCRDSSYGSVKDGCLKCPNLCHIITHFFWIGIYNSKEFSGLPGDFGWLILCPVFTHYARYFMLIDYSYWSSNNGARKFLSKAQFHVSCLRARDKKHPNNHFQVSKSY